MKEMNKYDKIKKKQMKLNKLKFNYKMILCLHYKKKISKLKY